MFEPEISEEQAKDISTDGNRIRFLILDGEGWYLGEPFNEQAPSDALAVREFAKRHEFRAPVIIRNPEDSGEMLVYLTKRAEISKKLREVSLKEHREAVAQCARRLALGRWTRRSVCTAISHERFAARRRERSAVVADGHGREESSGSKNNWGGEYRVAERVPARVRIAGEGKRCA